MGGEGLDDCGQKNETDGSGDDNCKESERPFKKARYAWQVKGKYHLKGAVEEQNDDTATVEEINSNSVKHRNENIICGGRCCIETLLNNSAALMASDESSDEECILRSTSRSPVSLIKSLPKNEDYYLNKWQEKQLARGYLDNSVNEVIEKWMPIVPSIDVGGIIDDCDSDGIVEDEGILMAIQSHGLQSTQGNWYPNELNNKRKSVPFVSTQELAVSALDNIQNAQNELLKSKNEEQSFVDFEMGFLDAAVAAAIEKKGLTSQSY